MTFRRSFLSDINPSTIDIEKIKSSIENKINLIHSYKLKNRPADILSDIAYSTTSFNPKLGHKSISSANIDHNVISNRAIKKSKVLDIMTPRTRNNSSTLEYSRLKKAKRIHRLFNNPKVNNNLSVADRVKPIKLSLESLIDSVIPSMVYKNDNVRKQQYTQYYENSPVWINKKNFLPPNKKVDTLDKFIPKEELQSSLLDTLIDSDHKIDDKMAVKNLDQYIKPSLFNKDSFSQYEEDNSSLFNQTSDSQAISSSSPKIKHEKLSSVFSNAQSDLSEDKALSQRLNDLEKQIGRIASNHMKSSMQEQQNSNNDHLKSQGDTNLENIIKSIANLQNDLIKKLSEDSKNNYFTKEQYKLNEMMNKIATLEASNNKYFAELQAKEVSSRLQQIENQMLHDKILKSVLLTQDIENLKNSQKNFNYVLEGKIAHNVGPQNIKNIPTHTKPAFSPVSPVYANVPDKTKNILDDHKSIISNLSHKVDKLEQILLEINTNIMTKQEEPSSTVLSEQLEDISTELKNLAQSNDLGLETMKASFEIIDNSLENFIEMCALQLKNTEFLTNQIRESREEIKNNLHLNKDEIIENLSNIIFMQLKQFAEYFNDLYSKLSTQISLIDNMPVKFDKGTFKVAVQRVFSILKDLTNLQEINLQEIVGLRNNMSSQYTISHNKLNICIKTLSELQQTIENYMIKDKLEEGFAQESKKGQAKTQKNAKIAKNYSSAKVKSQNIDVDQNMVYLENILKNNLKEINDKD